jgi:hypothetical protein
MRPRLTYANVVATLALFLALTGGAVYAASKISGKEIKKNSLPGNRIKANTVTNKQVKKQTLTANRIKKATLTNEQIKPGTIQRSALAAGTLSDVIIADASATNLAGASVDNPPGPTPVPLGGTTTFTPVAGKGYNVTGELVGNPVPVPGFQCDVYVQTYVNGVPLFFLELEAEEPDPPYDTVFPRSSYTASLLTASGPQTLSSKTFGDPDCAGNTTLNSFRLVVTEFG